MSNKIRKKINKITDRILDTHSYYSTVIKMEVIKDLLRQDIKDQEEEVNIRKKKGKEKDMNKKNVMQIKKIVIQIILGIVWFSAGWIMCMNCFNL